ncbi:calcium-binding protein [Leisingera sp. ANG-Vp]|uniref:calcium-binding protein n=1 Tax=Leisingera sp. ANG-Vp TaxID=1577896 RepID=UPI000A594C30|nr:hypothetical protein [Leisingera sp. ANG-Vp]
MTVVPEGESITGTDDQEELTGTGQNDTIQGGAGDDAISAGNGDERLRGGAGDDLLSGGLMYEVPQDQAADALDDFQSGLDVRFTPEFSSVSDDGASDTLVGGDGLDTLIAGDGDVLTGGGGSGNDFVTGYWAEGNTAAVVTDFDLDEDALLYYYPEAEGAPELTVEIEDNGSGGQDSVLYADGSAIMRINGTGGTLSVDVHVRAVASFAEI